MTEEANLRYARLNADMAYRRKEWVLVMSSHSPFPLSLLPNHLHSEASLLKTVDALYLMVPLKPIQCSSLPVSDVNINM